MEQTPDKPPARQQRQPPVLSRIYLKNANRGSLTAAVCSALLEHVSIELALGDVIAVMLDALQRHKNTSLQSGGKFSRVPSQNRLMSKKVPS